MVTFSPLLDALADIPDSRRAEGKLYKLPRVLLFSILAIVCGSNSYRGVVTFIDVHRAKLNAAFGLTWRRAPAHTAIRYILQGLDPIAVDAVFRRHAVQLHETCTKPRARCLNPGHRTRHGGYVGSRRPQNREIRPQIPSAHCHLRHAGIGLGAEIREMLQGLKAGHPSQHVPETL